MPASSRAKPAAPVETATTHVTRRSARSLQAVLLAALGGLFVLATVALYAGARSYGERSADLSYDNLLQSSALSMADSVTNVQGQWQVDLPYAALDLLALAPQDRAFYRITAPDGQLITGYADLPDGGSPRKPSARVAGDSKPYFFNATYRGEDVRFIRIPRYISGNQEGGVREASPVWIQVGQTRQARNELAGDIVWRAWVFIGGLMLAAFLLLGLAVHWALRPLARLQRELANRPASDLSPVASPVPRELRQVVQALDDFMARLSVNLDALRTFIAEAAHQIRTPLAALIAQTQEGLDDGDPGRQREALQAVERNALRLRRLVNQLLSDASVSHQGYLRDFEPVDLRQLLHEAVLDVSPRAEPQVRVQLAWEESGPQPPAPAWVNGDALMLREAFKNLIDNALKYGRSSDWAEDSICVDVALYDGANKAQPRTWLVEISDNGPGLPQERREVVFQRFVRSGVVNGVPAGAGLGLSIVQRVVDSHHGRIELRDRRDGRSGLVVLLWLPALETVEKGDGGEGEGRKGSMEETHGG